MKVQYLSLRFFQCFFQFQTYDDYLHLGNFDGLTWPTPVEEIDVFEKNNPTWAVNIIAMKADNVDEERLVTRREKAKQRKKLVESEFKVIKFGFRIENGFNMI